MAAKIGPTFYDELRAAGVPTDGLGWEPDTGVLRFLPSVTPQVQAQAQAVLAAHDPTKLTPALILKKAIAAGCQIVSTSTPALNGTYAIDDVSLARITSVAAGIAARNRVPGGGATFNHPDINGKPIAFIGPKFLDLAQALEDYVYALLQGQAPTQPITIP